MCQITAVTKVTNHPVGPYQQRPRTNQELTPIYGHARLHALSGGTLSMN